MRAQVVGTATHVGVGVIAHRVDAEVLHPVAQGADERVSDIAQSGGWLRPRAKDTSTLGQAADAVAGMTTASPVVNMMAATETTAARAAAVSNLLAGRGFGCSVTY